MFPARRCKHTNTKASKTTHSTICWFDYADRSPCVAFLPPVFRSRQLPDVSQSANAVARACVVLLRAPLPDFNFHQPHDWCSWLWLLRMYEPDRRELCQYVVGAARTVWCVCVCASVCESRCECVCVVHQASACVTVTLVVPTCAAWKRTMRAVNAWSTATPIHTLFAPAHTYMHPLLRVCVSSQPASCVHNQLA